MLVKQGNDGFGIWRAACQEQRDHVLFFNQLASIVCRQLRVELVVQRNQRDLLPASAALGIDRIK